MSEPRETHSGPPVYFLERHTYRRRRLEDAARLLPVIGAFAWLVPLLWPRQGPEAPGMGNALIYIFGVWIVLALIGAILSQRLGRREPPEPVRSAEE